MLAHVAYRGRMRVFDMIVAERSQIADLLDTLTPGQFRRPSLCTAWTVHDVAAHFGPMNAPSIRRG